MAYSDIVRDSYIDYREKNITVTNQVCRLYSRRYICTWKNLIRAYDVVS